MVARLKTVSQPEAARILGFSENTIAKWIKAGLLPAKREPGGRARIRMVDLQAFVETWPDYRSSMPDYRPAFAAISATAETPQTAT